MDTVEAERASPNHHCSSSHHDHPKNLYDIQEDKKTFLLPLLSFCGMMDVKLNGVLDARAENGILVNGNGHGPIEGADEDASLVELEAQLPVVYDGQVELRDLLSRMVQAVYAELTEMAETSVSFIQVSE